MDQGVWQPWVTASHRQDDCCFCCYEQLLRIMRAGRAADGCGAPASGFWGWRGGPRGGVGAVMAMPGLMDNPDPDPVRSHKPAPAVRACADCALPGRARRQLPQ